MNLFGDYAINIMYHRKSSAAYVYTVERETVLVVIVSVCV